MISIARTALAFTLLAAACGVTHAQTGPSDPQIISRADMAKISIGNRKLAGHVNATVRVAPDGSVTDVLVTENTTEEGFEPHITKLLRSAKFRPAIDAEGRVAEGSVNLKVELRQSTGDSPRPVPANPDPQANEKEKARIRNMRCSDFVWEWDLIRKEAGDAVTLEFMPRTATQMYATMRTEAGDYVDVKVWKEAPKGLREAVDQCRDNPTAPFWEGVFKPVMDEEVPK